MNLIKVFFTFVVVVVVVFFLKKRKSRTGTVFTLVSVSPRRAKLPALLGLVLMVLSSCSIEQRSAMRASRSTFSPWFNASAATETSACETRPANGAREEICFEVRLPETVCVCVCLTVDVVDGESVGEVGHVSLLSEGSFLLRGLLRASIIQTLVDRRRREFMCASPLSCLSMFPFWYSVAGVHSSMYFFNGQRSHFGVTCYI